MKQLFLGLSFILISGFAGSEKKEITPADRKFAIDYFLKTKQRLLNDVQKLSDAQLNYKPDSTRWSVAQCIEHIALAENGIWQWCMMTLKNDSAMLIMPERPLTNEQLIAGVTDRSKKAQAPEVLRPGNQFTGAKEALAAYVSKRDSIIQFLRTTQEPMETHYMQTPAGTLNVFQGFLLLAAHSERHTLQIEEVMKSPGFPKK
ncbi:DinB family protein [Niabella sp. CC-SYL272]|uniref:DinB family protein n=1 Tax=Niabella agricola TaxID=2891571 RepID=UPI001F390CB3|nr:DinB family protein [Niabella agricola]MCF3108454.1 DinB family protein [Niabella agricola]